MTDQNNKKVSTVPPLGLGGTAAPPTSGLFQKLNPLHRLIRDGSVEELRKAITEKGGVIETEEERKKKKKDKNVPPTTPACLLEIDKRGQSLLHVAVDAGSNVTNPIRSLILFFLLFRETGYGDFHDREGWYGCKREGQIGMDTSTCRLFQGES